MNIPTAEEFIELTELLVKFDNTQDCILAEELPNLLINFTKLHVEAALKEAGERAYFRDSNEFIFTPEENKQAILNSYPLTNIK